jgi:tRNA pseudouridine38-40 synthase
MANKQEWSADQEKVALLIQYVGTNYHGWQRQPNQVTIQEEIERAIASVVGHPVTIYGAGRTDAGVHATAQVAHFNYSGPVPAEKWAKIINGRLPDGILIRASKSVPPDWHARFSALWRRYRYTLYTDPTPNLFVKPYTWHYYYQTLSESLIQAALNPLIGKHDLAAFERAGSNRSHAWVEVQAVECYRRGAFLHLEIQADGFLYGMVRLLVGMLVEVGTGVRSLENFTAIWQNQRRDLVKYSAPAQGLCLLRVGYQPPPFPDPPFFFPPY